MSSKSKSEHRAGRAIMLLFLPYLIPIERISTMQIKISQPTLHNNYCKHNTSYLDVTVQGLM